jgi:hypothetical protein
MSDETIIRPNGKPYTPRKGLRQIGFDHEDGHTSYVVVLGTHDIEKAREFGRPYQCAYLVKPYKGWGRWTIRNGEEWWEFDDVRGAAGVVFEEADDPDPAPSTPEQEEER